MLTDAYLRMANAVLRVKGVAFDAGLDDAELARAEEAVGARFPPDLRRFLMHALPRGERFPDWRAPDSELVRGRLAWPADSICFDIEHNEFWMPGWGGRPSTLEAACAHARHEIAKAPPLIPIYTHRYLPATPCLAGNPVFSVYQTDVIYYGEDLADYLHREFEVPPLSPPPDETREIEFWSLLESRDELP